MNTLTYRQLRDQLAEMNETELDQEVVAFDYDIMMPVNKIEACGSYTVLVVDMPDLSVDC
jgi:hypothetical protein